MATATVGTGGNYRKYHLFVNIVNNRKSKPNMDNIGKKINEQNEHEQGDKTGGTFYVVYRACQPVKQ